MNIIMILEFELMSFFLCAFGSFIWIKISPLNRGPPDSRIPLKFLTLGSMQYELRDLRTIHIKLTCLSFGPVTHLDPL